MKWHTRPASREYTCLWCLETIRNGDVHIHGDRSPYVNGKHEERGLYFHLDCIGKMKRALEQYED